MSTVEPGWIWDQVSDLDYAHAALVLRLPEGWLKQMAPAERIPSTKYGKHVHFTPENIAEIRRMHYRPVRGAAEPVEIETQRAAIRAALVKQSANNIGRGQKVSAA